MALRGGLANTGAGFVLLDSCFSVVLFVVRSSVRAFGRSFRGSFFGFVLLVVLFVVRALGSCFWSFFSWFVLLVVLFVVRSFGGSYVFLFDALKVLEACVARSEVS